MFTENGKAIVRSEDEVDERVDRTITSIFENRLPIFLPFKKLHQSRIEKIFEENDNAVFFDTDFGKIKVKHRLVTQQHKLYLEAMLSYQKQLLTDGSFYVKFKIYDILKNKLGKKNPTDYETFKKYLEELDGIGITIYTKDNKELGFGFIEDYTIDNETGEYVVKFTRALSSIWRKENLLDYKKTLPELARIEDPVICSVIRYMSTYGNLQIGVKNLANKLGLNNVFGKSALYNQLNKIRDSFDENHLNNQLDVYAKFGIEYDPEFDNVVINRSSEIFIEHKDNTLTSKLIEVEKNPS